MPKATIIDIITALVTIAMAVFTLVGSILAIWQFIKKRAVKNYNLLFDNFFDLYKRTEICMEKK